MYAKWIQSWRDLPVLINQWANVVRWEKVTRPFLRTTEFLWQEGHTAHETDDEARGRDAEDPRALQGVRRDRAGDAGRSTGRRARARSSPARSRTYSIEALMGDGRALQAGTSHNLGQNFAKAFDITVPGARQDACSTSWTTSWGVSTRLIGGVIMTHGDDSGLVLPPRDRAVPGRDRADRRAATGRRPCCRKAQEIRERARGAGVRVMLDDRDEYTPGWKFAEWELRGVPLRLEIGPKDIEKSQVHARAPRHAREAADCRWTGSRRGRRRCSTTSRTALFERALQFREEHTQRVTTYDEFKAAMEGRPGFVIARLVRKRRVRGADQGRDAGDDPQHSVQRVRRRSGTCVKCGQPAKFEAWFAKAY